MKQASTLPPSVQARLVRQAKGQGVDPNLCEGQVRSVWRGWRRLTAGSQII